MIHHHNLAAKLMTILAARGKRADFTREVICVDHGDGLGPRLAYWDPSLGPTPTQAEVDAATPWEPPVVPTLDDVIAVLPPEAKAALNARLAAKRVTP